MPLIYHIHVTLTKSMLEITFRKLMRQYHADEKKIEELWTEIERRYSRKGRHYHTLLHLEALLNELTAVKDKIGAWETVVFTLLYHDIVYDATRHDNEEKSAELAAARLNDIVPLNVIDSITAQISATGKHEPADSDTDYFTDADLSVLGTDPEHYRRYALAIRKEYSIYPDLLYRPGRKKVLQHFLAMPRIFKTEHFYNKYEVRARINLAEELEGL